ncbi:hypothetical protein HDU81_009389 [Chytriomyces hyalinus]|nr:hypothetical protein HDU81_009389 [Chytriomyces hyalinus]
MSSSVLTETEAKMAVVNTLLWMFQQVSNVPADIDALTPLYFAQKGGVVQRTAKALDRNSGPRSYITIWNAHARRLQVGGHISGLNGCYMTGFHRVCRSKNRKTLYWIDPCLAETVLSKPLPQCKCLKTAHSGFVCYQDGLLRSVDVAFAEAVQNDLRQQQHQKLQQQQEQEQRQQQQLQQLQLQQLQQQQPALLPPS